jgi:hypothetical protein
MKISRSLILAACSALTVAVTACGDDGAGSPDGTPEAVVAEPGEWVYDDDGETRTATILGEDSAGGTAELRFVHSSQGSEGPQVHLRVSAATPECEFGCRTYIDFDGTGWDDYDTVQPGYPEPELILTDPVLLWHSLSDVDELVLRFHHGGAVAGDRAHAVFSVSGIDPSFHEEWL